MPKLTLTASKQHAKPFKLRPEKKFVPKEYDEQVAVFEYAEMAAKQDPRWALLFATLNGVRLPIGLAVKVKKAGMIKGVPDLVLPVACGGWFGWFGEGKRIKGGRVSDVQTEYMKSLVEQNYKVEVWRGAQACISAITAYLSLPSTRNP